jgi:hypothetical protein
MNVRPRNFTVAMMAVGALVPFAAGAQARTDDTPGARPNPALVCGKDYSVNSVGGNYCALRTATPSPVSSPPGSPAKVVADRNGFAWGDAAAGAGSALALVLVATGTTTAVRRRRTPGRSGRAAISG